MVSTQDVSFGSAWTRLLGDGARWDSGTEELPAMRVRPEPLAFGAGLVAVWVAGDGPILVCDPQKGLRAIKGFQKGVSVDALRAALREAGAVMHEAPPGARD